MKLYRVLIPLLFPLIAIAANQQDLEKLLQLKKDQPLRLDLSNTDLRNYSFTPDKIDLQQANMSHSNLSGVDLSKMNLGGADLSYADLSNAKLSQSNLADANLDHANLTGAELQQSDLSRANLGFAMLTGANLQQTLFANANLTCANLNQANLSKANFTQANISGATFINTVTADIVGYDSVADRKANCG
jgi:uncharacterized protein YjbI with pentapeptide repeats